MILPAILQRKHSSLTFLPYKMHNPRTSQDYSELDVWIRTDPFTMARKQPCGKSVRNRYGIGMELARNRRDGTETFQTMGDGIKGMKCIGMHRPIENPEEFFGRPMLHAKPWTT